jgi:hypothetical protein
MRFLPVGGLGRSLADLQNLLGITEQPNIEPADQGSYASYSGTGVAVLMKDAKVVSLFLYANGHDGFSGYRGDLGKLRTDSAKQTIRFLFGLPSQAREAASSKVLGTFPIYDRYDYDDYSYHFQYDPYGIRLQMLTTMSAEEVRQLGHDA